MVRRRRVDRRGSIPPSPGFVPRPGARMAVHPMTLSAAQFEFLRSIDTPTVCNLLEIVAPERRGAGYTVKHLHCPFPDLPAMVGFAKTVTIRAKDAIAAGDASY